MAQPQRALEDANTAIEMDPGYAKGHYRRAHALEQLGRPKDARAAMKCAKELEAADVRSQGAPGGDSTAAATEVGGGGVGGDADGGGADGGGGAGGDGSGGGADSGGDAAVAEDERVVELLDALRPTLAGSEARRALVEELHALLARVAEEGSKQLQRVTVRAFVDAEGPEILYEMESSMRGNWMADAKNGTLSNLSKISRLPGAIGRAVYNYRGMHDRNKQAAADRTCTHPEHAGMGVQPQR